MIIKHRDFIVGTTAQRPSLSLVLIWFGIPAAWAILLSYLLYQVIS